MLSSSPLLRVVAAFVLLGLGAVGLLLPIIPGIPLLIVGGWLLRGRRTPTHAAPMLDRRGLNALERLHVNLLLFARRLTTTAESLRVAYRDRQRRG